MNSESLTVLTGTLLGGGLAGSISQLYLVRRKRDNVVVTGAEAAVLSMQRSIDAEAKRADRAEAENELLRRKISELEARLDTVQNALDTARNELHALNQTLRAK